MKAVDVKRPRLKLMTIALSACFAGGFAHAAPVGPVVVNGHATFAANGNVLSITNSPGAIINWQQFSIGAGEITRFVQLSAASSVLNRVTGADPSRILGALQSNGRVFLINPNGILFGAGSQINVAGLVASTLNLTNEDFLAGRMRFGGDGAITGTVVNRGSIHADAAGHVYLIGSSVDNRGTITAPNGDIVLAAGQSARVTDSLAGTLQVEVTAPADQAVNLSRLAANPAGAFSGLVRNSGALRADAAVAEAGGRIVLKATRGVNTSATSVLTASGASGGSITAASEQGVTAMRGTIEAIGRQAEGGRIAIAGERTVLADATRVDASGATAGGTILVGGDVHGRAIAEAGSALPISQRTFVAQSAQLRADATHSGDGGTVVVWADDVTRYYGSISARGGAGGGNGGFVETSGKNTLDFSGSVDTSAAAGRTGTLLLDPSDITISNFASTSMTGGPSFGATAAASNLNVSTLQTALASNNVIVDTTSPFAAAGNITVANAVTWASANSLTLRAHNDITVNAAVTATGPGAMSMIADQDASGAGGVALNARLVSAGGSVSISGASVRSTLAATITTTGAANADGGAVSITSPGSIDLAGAITANGGAGTAGAAGRNAGAVALISTGAGVVTGAITANGGAGSAGAGAAGGSGGNVAVSSVGAITTGALQASGGAAGGTNGSGGNAGVIAVTNSSATSGTLTTGALTASTGAATGAGAGGVAGGVTVSNNAAALLTTGAIVTSGGAKGNGGDVLLTSRGDVHVNATNLGTSILTSGGATVGTMAGTAAGDVTIRGVNRAIAGRILASGGAGVGADQNGGHAGAVLITGTDGTAASAGALSMQAATASGGAATGTGMGAVAGSITLAGTTVSAGALTTAGGANGAGGAVTAAATGGSLITGEIIASGGTNGSGGDVTLSSQGDVQVAATALGTSIFVSGGNATGSGAGAAGGNVTITGRNRAIAGSIRASGGAAAGINQNGGDAGVVLITGIDGTPASAGTLVTQGVTASTGAATGTGTGGGAGAITLDGTTVSAGALTTTGGANGAGGAVTARAATGLLNVTGAIVTSGGSANANSPGNKAGDVNLSGAGVMTMGITAHGANGSGAGFAGGAGGNVTVTASAGAVTVGAISTIGGNGTAGDAAGGNAGTITLASGGAAPGIALRGNLTARGGNRTGNAAAGAGAQVWLKDAVLLDTASVTIAANGGSTGGTGGTVRFDGAIDSTGGARALTVNTNAATIFSGAVGAGAALASLATDAGGATQLNGGQVRTTGAQTYADALTLGANAVLTGTTGSFTGAIDGGNHDLALNFSGVTTVNAGTFTNVVNFATGNGGTTQLSGAVTTAGSQTYGDAVTLTAATTLTSTGAGDIEFANTLNGARTLGINTAGATVFGGVVGGTQALTSLTTDASGSTAINTAGITTTGAQTYNDSVTLGANATLAAGTLTFASTVNGSFGLTANSAGVTTFGGAVGGSSPLAALTTNATGTTVINGGAVTTAGVQTYNDALTLGADTILTGAAGTFTGVINGANHDLSLDFSGTTAINGGSFANIVNFTTGNAGTTQLSGAITTAGSQTYNDAVSLAAATTLTSTGAADIEFANTVNGAQALIVNTGGTTRWREVVGGVQALASITTDAGGTTAFSGAGITTTGAQIYNDPVTLGTDTTLNAGAITFASTVDGAFRLISNAGGAITFGGAVGGGTPLAALTAVADGALTLNGAVTATAAGDSLVLSTGSSFVNNAGANALNAGAGRWLVYSASPGLDTPGGLINDFKQYNAAYGVTPVLGAGNGFLYQLAPVVSASLVGSVSKVYDGTTAAALTSGNYAVSGAIDGDIVTLNDPLFGSFDTRNVGAGKNVSVSGLAVAGASNAAISVYGYQLASSTASANIGTITARALTIGSQAGQGKAYGSDDPAAAATAYAPAAGTTLGAGDVLVGSMGRVAGEAVGAYAFTAGTTAVSDGNGGNNYSVTFDGATSPFRIDPAKLTGTVASQTKVYGSNDPLPGGIAVTLNGVVNRVVTDINGNNTAINDTGNVSTSLAALVRAPGENVGSYSITAGTLNALTGSAAGNYSVALDPATATLAITPAALTATIADQTKVFGTADPAPASIAVTLGGVVNNPAIVTWNGNAAIDDTTNVAASLASLVRTPGESLGSYPVLSGTLNALSGSAAANYVATLNTAGNVLSITPFQLVAPGMPSAGGAAPVVIPGSAGISAGVVAGAMPALTAFFGPIIHGINLSALDPGAAFGASGSTSVAENAPSFFDTLPPTAAGLADAGGFATTGDPATVTLGEQPSRRCFDVQPLNQLWCRKGR